VNKLATAFGPRLRFLLPGTTGSSRQSFKIREDEGRGVAQDYAQARHDLFGAWCFIREWGRIGRPGQLRHVPYPTEDEAKEALARQRRVKERRGYRSA
jgi:predicted DNA-binding WGR domain protein